MSTLRKGKWSAIAEAKTPNETGNIIMAMERGTAIRIQRITKIRKKGMKGMEMGVTHPLKIFN